MSPQLPGAETISKAAQVAVFDSEGKEVPFGSLIDGDKKTIVVFIRHFFCGSCKQYTEQLATVREDALKDAGATILLVGCGDWQPIKHYNESTGFRGPIYANPGRELYQIFEFMSGLKMTPSGQEKRSYLGRGVLSNVIHSIWDGPLKNPAIATKGGPSAQNGGDFVFGPDQSCIFAHRMEHTEDHVEVEDLMKAAGVAYP
ncbi:AhpC/TSA antioxidant enzyme-domain-containing protein [Epithele typhae]|uniref:AhpC/TSA antioxidant enzyme-domain-containing protein n=1 Tax=Epithele typhae TaxID=378194 RepID=UPI002008B319|nr:AhpC/TSA antioxidant enzyme-domain-containing protein [Epithele typhae]KAH9945811.1 AhpC/TSA antioxidant enzyme-domain-containing protein [Epithele typhae]